MNKVISLILLTLLVSLRISAQNINEKSVAIKDFPKQDVTEPLVDILNEIKIQYDEAIKMLGDIKNIEIDEADVTFDVTNTNIEDGNISVLIFKSDIKRTGKKESTITFSLIDSTDNNKAMSFSLKKDFIKKTPNYELAKLIANTAKAFVSINTKIGKLKGKTFEIDIVYSVELDGSIDISGKIISIRLDGSYERDHQVQNTIKLIFKTKN